MDRRISTPRLRKAFFSHQQLFLAMGSLLLGLGSVLIASAFIQQDYKQAGFQTDGVYRICKWMTGPDGSQTQSIKTPGMLAPALEASQPGSIAEVGRYMPWPEPVTVTSPNRTIDLNGWAFSDPAILHLFRFNLLHGSLENALSDPGHVVLTERTARAIFGISNAVGFPLKGMGGQVYTVQAVLQDLPKHSPLHFDLLASWSSTSKSSGMQHFAFMHNWTAQLTETYVRVQNTGLLAEAEASIRKITNETPNPSGFTGLFLEPLSDFTAKTGGTGAPDASGAKYGAHFFQPGSTAPDLEGTERKI
ncbi:MAG: hypothetical protein EP344_08755 [Bacteroidetes bacterium]|nr:MAG: hypothetical protein EP344_08755 [Bacteroidota bacterium]